MKQHEHCYSFNYTAIFPWGVKPFEGRGSVLSFALLSIFSWYLETGTSYLHLLVHEDLFFFPSLPPSPVSLIAFFGSQFLG